MTQSRKRANKKWDEANMVTLVCRVKRPQAEAFKAYCEGQGQTSNAILKNHVLQCIGEKQKCNTRQEGAEWRTEAFDGCGSILPPETIKAAQEAAQATGEGIGEFIARAVERQIQTDKVSLRLGINPASPNK